MFDVLYEYTTHVLLYRPSQVEPTVLHARGKLALGRLKERNFALQDHNKFLRITAINRIDHKIM